MIWEPGRIQDHDLLMYLRACHSIADLETWVDKKMVENQLAMHDGETLESPDNGFLVATKDGIGLNAIQKLHESGYDTGKALQVGTKKFFKNFFQFNSKFKFAAFSQNSLSKMWSSGHFTVLCGPSNRFFNYGLKGPFFTPKDQIPTSHFVLEPLGAPN